MIPCKQLKCLMLPVCKSKEDIICEELTDHLMHVVWDIEDIPKYQKEYNKAWTKIRRILPLVKSVTHEEDYVPYRQPKEHIT